MIGDQELVSVGLNHRTAPVAIRELLAVPQQELPRHLLGLRGHGVTSESVILSTCNRVEVYAVVPAGDGGAGITRYLASEHGIKHRELERHIYRYAGCEAVGHLFRVASSLDSMVVGEPQILGQVKDAFKAAREHGSLGRVMHPLMRRTMTVAKRVRTQTAVGQSSVSVGTAGVDLARQVFGNLERRRALLLGAGEMGRLVARSLLAHGVEELVVANRTYANAVELSRHFGGSAVHMDQLDSYLGQVDIAVVSTGAQHHLLTRARMAPIMRGRRYRPLFLVDLSVPRNVAPDVHEIEGAYVFNVDDLSAVAQAGLKKRKREATVAEAIVREEAERCYESLGARAADPVIATITRRAEIARLAELQRSRKTLEQLTPEQRQVVEAMTRSMMKRSLHNVLRQARSLAATGDEEGLRQLGEAFEDSDE